MRNKEQMYAAVEAHRQELLDAERYIWKHPELGFREWNTHRYLKEKYEAMGCTVHEAGNIPGFYVDIDTGRPGPCLGVFGELDALCIPEHPESDPQTGAVHACGHHWQNVAALGMAYGLLESGMLEQMSGRIRLFAVPCEELLDHNFMQQLFDSGAAQFKGGKQEFIRRGLLDGVDMSIMLHGGMKGFSTNTRCNGNVAKRYTFLGKTAHVASTWSSCNALYAANHAMNTVNALRETFPFGQMIGAYAIVSHGGDAIGNIPDRVVVDAGLRAGNLEALRRISRRIDRAYAASAAGMGCRLELDEVPGYLPRLESTALEDVFHEVAEGLFPPEERHRKDEISPGCTDFGDISQMMPVCHAFIGDGGPAGHTTAYRVVDAAVHCVTGAKLLAGVADTLLRGDAERAKALLENDTRTYMSRDEYLSMMQEMSFKGELVNYEEDGSITLRIPK